MASAAASADISDPVTPNSSLLMTGTGDLAARATLLALFLIVGVVANCVLVATIAQSRRLQRVTINLFIISVCVANLLECLVNMPLILGATIRENWDYGSFLCKVNACLTQLLTISMVFGLFLMTLDRFLVIRYPGKAILTLAKARGLIVYGWIHATAFSLPLVLDTSVAVSAFPARYSCSIHAEAPLLYVAFTSLLGILLPLLVIIGFYVFIIRVGIKERNRRTQHSYTEDDNIESSRLRVELSAAKYVGLLVLIWAILQGPYLLLTFVEQYRTTTEIEASLLLDFDYPWEMELAFTWMRLSFPMFIPIITFCWMKEVWQRFKNFFLCRKSNLIIDASPVASPGHHSSNMKQEDEMEASLSVPVIFATEEGLHFQTFTKRAPCHIEENQITPDGYPYMEINGSQILTSRKCDIYGSQDFVQIREDEDTSDYDSHGDMDPLSNSNGISIASGEMTNEAFQEDGQENHKKETDQQDISIQQDKKKTGRIKRIEKHDVDKRDNDSGRGSLQEKQQTDEHLQSPEGHPTEEAKIPKDPVVKPKKRKKKPQEDVQIPERNSDIDSSKPVPVPRVKVPNDKKPRKRREREPRPSESGHELSTNEESLTKDVAVQCRTKEKYIVGPEMDEQHRVNKKSSRKERPLPEAPYPMVNYKDMHILAAKAVSERVHIAPKTPDTAIDVIEYPAVTSKPKM